ncbi:MAG: CarD family transcriptional regulator [Desulfobacteraceae bacterium]|nr:CarD family transcriptional regulator [Desulfobacteraceae bacterium]MCF8094778.1 CarD family transcriptional regulator [Desulfobacteraceae bacterium]
MAEKAQPQKETARGFDVGDLVVYPAHGVGRIESIESRVINGDTHDFYIMKIIDNDMVIMVPTKNVEAVGLRSVIDESEIPGVYEILAEQKHEIQDNQTWNRRYKEYMDRIKTGSPHDVAAVFRELYLLKLTKDLSFGERKLLDTAKALLLGEICTAKNQDEDRVWAEIESLFSGNGNGNKKPE